MSAQQQKRLTKRQKRILRQQGVLDEDNHVTFTVAKHIKPKTDNQAIAFESWDDGYNVFLHGIAGTGKTFLALYFALKEVFNSRSPYKKVFIIRSTVSTRNQGFLPGTQKQKEAAYEEPYPPICAEIFERNDAYAVLKQRDMVEFRSTSFLRGVTFDDCIIVVDEVQNMSFQECDTIMTRVGENARIIFAGDIKQDDLTSARYNEQSGIADFMRIINNMDEFDFIEFYADDIVRSALVKSYIIERDRLGL